MKQEIVLDERTLNNLLQHVIGSARSCSNLSVYDNLKLLGEVLYENGVKCQKVYCFHGLSALSFYFQALSEAISHFVPPSFTMSCWVQSHGDFFWNTVQVGVLILRPERQPLFVLEISQ